MDRVSKEKRSEIMSLIKSKDTKPELLIFNKLRERDIYFQKHYKKAPGRPDVAFPRKKIAVFINGEFWHGKNLDKYRGSLTDFWINKIETNMSRDKKNYKKLKDEGWMVLILWDKDIYKNLDKEVDKIEKLKLMK